MTYFFRQQHYLRKDAAFEAQHPRGKTTPESNSGSFRPAEVTSSEGLLVMNPPPKGKPVHLVFGGSFNPPHAGHVKTAALAYELLKEAGYEVQGVTIAPSADKLLSAKPRKEGEMRFNLAERAALVQEYLSEYPYMTVSTTPGEEQEAFQGKIKRVHLAQSVQRAHQDATIVNITGEDQADMAEVPRFPALFTGNKGTSHEGYYYIALPRDSEKGVSSSKIRAAHRSGAEIPEEYMPRKVQLKMRELLSRQARVTKSWLEIAKEAVWREDEHPRGKTSPKSTDGSFAPKEGRSASSSKPLEKPTPLYVSYKGMRINTKLVQGAESPAQMLQAAYGGLKSQEEIIASLRDRVAPSEWDAFVAASEAAAKLVAEQGDSRQRNATMVNGEWVFDETRVETVHQPILDMYIERYKALAEKSDGGTPEFVVLAGRGGSGKSAFGLNRAGEVDQRYFGFYDRSYLEINPDDVKIALRNAVRASGLYGDEGDLDPEGDAAGYWHEESSTLTKQIQAGILRYIEQNPDKPKANIVLDLTLANKKSDVIQKFTAKGYEATLAGLFIPAEESAYGALSRWQGSGGVRKRLVGVSYIANSKNNEKNFDEMIRETNPLTGKPLISSWFLYTGGESHGTRPALVAKGGKTRTRGNT